MRVFWKMSILLLVLFLAASPASADRPTAMVDLIRTKGLADGSIYFDHLHFHKHVGKVKRVWGPAGTHKGIGFHELHHPYPVLKLTSVGDEKQIVLVVHRVKSDSKMRVYWDGKSLGDKPLPAGWSALAWTIPGNKAGPHLIKLSVVSRGKSEELKVNSRAKLAIARLYLINSSAKVDVAQQIKMARKSRDTLWLQAGQRLTWYFPLPLKSDFRVSSATGNLTLRVSWTQEGGKKKVLLEKKAPFGSQTVSIPSSAGKISRITIEAIGSESGSLALRFPRLDAPLKAWTHKPGAKRPTNVIVYVIDSLRWDKFKFVNPKTRVKTPNFDKFIKDAVVFTHAYVQGNWSKSSAASLFTSMYPSLHRGHYKKSKLPRGVLLPQQLFRKAGFKTCGLIANGYVSERQGYHRGFDKYYNYITMRGPSRGKRIFKEVMQWLDKNGNGKKPFFMYVQTVDPHLPYRPPMKYRKMYFDFSKRPKPKLNPNNTGSIADWLQKHGRSLKPRDWEYYKALYDGEVTYTDHHFGKFVEFLKQKKLLENTLIVITSDHGEEFKEHNSVGHGHTLYDEVLHVPLIVRYPRQLPRGRFIHTTTEVMDVMPTVMQMAGLKPYAKHLGSSLFELLTGPEPRLPRASFSSMGNIASTIYLGRYKLIRFYKWSKKQFVYDLKADPGEKVDLRAKRPFLHRYLSGYLTFWEGAHEIWKKRKHGIIGDHRLRKSDKVVIK